nr:putative reverse transcriptase domain-containing protein [Tanacetum cinerariifolium]
LAKVGKVAYKLELPQELSKVHHTFHVSNLKKCYSDEPLVMPLEGVHIDDTLLFVEEPVEIMEREIKRLKRSRIPLVKVRWNSRQGPEFTWEREDSFKKKYPHLFTNRTSSSTTRISLDKISTEAKKVPNTVSASFRTKPIIVSQPNVITKKNVNSDLNGLPSTGLDNTKTKRPQPRSNTKNDRVPSTSKSSRSKNKEVKVEEHHRNLQLSKKNKHISSACNNSNSTFLFSSF